MVGSSSTASQPLVLALLAGAMVLALAAVAAAQGQSALTGDRIATANGDLVVHPVNHATLVLGWNGHVIYVDPVGGADRFSGLPRPDLVLITDIHGDHLDAATLSAVRGEASIIGAPAVVQQLPPEIQGKATRIANGEKTSRLGIAIEATPAYNTTADRTRFHAKGRGNGYLLTLGGKRVYISGDTEDIPEMRALKNIDVAFLCMNLPYTMTPEQAASAVREFHPRIVYPYHSRGTDLEKFKSLVGADSGVEVRIRSWY
jgi:L-ascorbate metabolism protein UlaG (beta-lactamase superfamily)